MKPMLAAPTDGTNLLYPIMVSPKLDGIRCLIKDGVAVSRSLKPIPNKHVQTLFGRPELNGLDGELIVCDATAGDVFQRTTSGVMSIEGTPKVMFFVFDDFSDPLLKFKLRLLNVQARCVNLKYCQLVKHFVVRTKEDLDQYEERFLEKGFEGLMVRDPNGLYKHGRSTLKQGWLLKMKRFEDSEAEVIGWLPLMRNNNPSITNLLGYGERSSKKEGKIESSMLGALMVRDLKTKVEFDIGTGFTEEMRKEFPKKNILGRIVKYKYQPVGVKEKPRFPVFLGFRGKIDL